ncbi:MAG TPA: hypothetical protein VFH61_04045, partial [Thermoleophilia bacterium]|nr:hypothetical protein [Thermoleophilia bacterium]
VLPVAFLLLAAAVLAGRGPAGAAPRTGLPVGFRFAVAAVSLAALAAIAIPYATTSSLRASQAQAEERAFGPALERARDAATIQPYAASPHLQEALLLELRGEVDAAVRAARLATVEEPTNWRTWFVLSRLEARAGDAEGSVAAFRIARDLNPRSPLFAETAP